ncbi:DUF4258 domain-containing protein [Virgibacillus natechei]|uniref:DUF4258 domain-containing protein n=1 Tax=Virgibacillus natechei TaxID=1216297 RepID=UPI0036280C25
MIMSVFQAELVKDYPDDLRGHSCLILSFVNGKAVHTVCGIHKKPALPKGKLRVFRLLKLI